MIEALKKSQENPIWEVILSVCLEGPEWTTFRPVYGPMSFRRWARKFYSTNDIISNYFSVLARTIQATIALITDTETIWVLSQAVLESLFGCGF